MVAINSNNDNFLVGKLVTSSYLNAADVTAAENAFVITVGVALLIMMCVVAFVAGASYARSRSQKSTIYSISPNLLQKRQYLFRHGDRTPTETYPTDPYRDMAKFWPEGLGQLTDRGKMQHYNLGKYFRERYHGFLAIKYSPGQVYVTSSDMDRTIMSAESNLAGLFPPVNKWNPNIDWQPIPIRTIPSQHDRYLHIHESCPKYRSLTKEFKNSEIVKKVNEENKDFIKYVAEQAGLNSNAQVGFEGERPKPEDGSFDVESIVFLQDIFFVQSVHNLSLPSWVYSNNVLGKLNELQTIVSTWRTYTQEMKRLRGGPLLDLFLKNMLVRAGLKEGKQRKMYVYSAHDSTLVRLMNTMGIFEPHNPPYAAALILELHKNTQTGQYFVEIFYKNDTNKTPHVLQYPQCGSPCYLKNMLKLAKPLIPRKWEKECQDASVDDEEDVGDIPSEFSSSAGLLKSPGSFSFISHKELDDEEDETRRDSNDDDDSNTPIPEGFLSNTGILVFCAVFFATVFVLWLTILRKYVFPPESPATIIERSSINKPTMSSTSSFFGYETI